MPIDRDRIQKNGWDQGSFFHPEDTARLLAEHGGRVRNRFDQPVRSLILASHSCDVLSHLDEAEPDATVFPVLELESGIQFMPSATRRSRVWHFEMNAAGDIVQRELLAHTGFSIPRGDLQNMMPWRGARLADRYKREFPRWLSVRWNRPAFPDAFNNRLAKVQQAIKKEIKRITKVIDAVLIYIDPDEEIPDGDATPYQVTLCILMKHDDFELTECRRQVEAALDSIVRHLRACRLSDGSSAFFIEEGACAARSMSQMSVAEYDEYSSFGYEELSFRDGSDLPPEKI